MKDLLKIYIPADKVFTGLVRYLVGHMSMHIKGEINYVDTLEDADLYISERCLDKDKTWIKINEEIYYRMLNRRKINYHEIISANISNYVFCDDEDLLAACIYMINCYQEIADGFGDCLDEYKRYTYRCSYQNELKFGNENLVKKIFEYIIEKKLEMKFIEEKSKVFLSHDIDTLNGSLLQDSNWAWKNRNYSQLIKILLSNLLGKKLWANFDKINAIHSIYNFKHSYFWLVENRTYDKIKNADYTINSVKQIILDQADSGLHKSSAPKSYADELKHLPLKVKINRNHFLKFQIESHWEKLENSGISIDCSLGFAEKIGFRNSYGMPIMPYNFLENRPYNVLSVPLNIMDSTLRNYMLVPFEKTEEVILDFLNQNKMGCIISILWHNTFFTDYKYNGYRQIYENVLKYLKDQQVETVDSEYFLKYFDKLKKRVS